MRIALLLCRLGKGDKANTIIFYVNFSKISVAVDEKFKLEDMKSFNGLCPRLPWLRLPSSWCNEVLVGSQTDTDHV